MTNVVNVTYSESTKTAVYLKCWVEFARRRYIAERPVGDGEIVV